MSQAATATSPSASADQNANSTGYYFSFNQTRNFLLSTDRDPQAPIPEVIEQQIWHVAGYFSALLNYLIHPLAPEPAQNKFSQFNLNRIEGFIEKTRQLDLTEQHQISLSGDALDPPNHKALCQQLIGFDLSDTSEYFATFLLESMLNHAKTLIGQNAQEHSHTAHLIFHCQIRNGQVNTTATMLSFDALLQSHHHQIKTGACHSKTRETNSADFNWQVEKRVYQYRSLASILGIT